MMNTFGFVSFLSSFWSLIVTPCSLFFVFFFVYLLGAFLGVGVCLFVFVFFWSFIYFGFFCFVLSGSNYTDILCCVNTARNYFTCYFTHSHLELHHVFCFVVQ